MKNGIAVQKVVRVADLLSGEVEQAGFNPEKLGNMDFNRLWIPVGKKQEISKRELILFGRIWMAFPDDKTLRKVERWRRKGTTDFYIEV